MHPGFKRLHRFTRWSRSPSGLVFVLWNVLSLFPYMVWGRQWGMIWILLNFPAAFAMEWLERAVGQPYHVLIVTISNAALLSLIVFLLGWIRRAFAARV